MKEKTINKINKAAEVLWVLSIWLMLGSFSLFVWYLIIKLIIR